MASRVTNLLLPRIARGEFNFETNVFKVALMKPVFSFNRINHGLWADVSGHELDAGHGYTAGGAILEGVIFTPNDAENALIVSWNNKQWTATDGDLAKRGAIVYNDSHADKALIGFIDYGETINTLAGGTHTLGNIFFALRGIK